MEILACAFTLSLVGCATDASPDAGTMPVTDEADEYDIARRETELTAKLYDGIATTYPDCRKMAATIGGFRAAHQVEIAALDRWRRPSDRVYLAAKRNAWERIMGPRMRFKGAATRACMTDPSYRNAIASVPSLDRRSYCKQPPPPPGGVAIPSLVPTTVRRESLENLRLEGDPAIQPRLDDALAIATEELGVVAIVKMCLDREGSVSEATLLETSCFDDYDAKLLAGVRSWRYRPFLVDGQPAPVCTSYTFVYSPR